MEYADLASPANLVDGTPGHFANYNFVPLSPYLCGYVPTTANNDLVLSLFNFYSKVIPQDQEEIAFIDWAMIWPTVGSPPACSGGEYGSCIFENTTPASGLATWTAPDPANYYPSWHASPTCQVGQGGCIANPVSCVAAAFKVIGP